ncbi:MAG: hypothetical protein H7Y86_01890 [Rhizobacter sp.]|nr:hypothetical protein [Ferruginibacter sp.]
MKLKIFSTAFISLVWISFPQNIIGCGPGIDPYDYYTSFMHPYLPETKAYQPFYYTGYSFLYEEQEPASPPEILANEWAGFCGMPVTDKDALNFVTKFTPDELKKLYSHIEKKQPLVATPGVKGNTMTGYFTRSKDLEGLGYIMYAKQVEPFVTGDYNNWEAISRDSVKMDKLIRNGKQLYNAAKNDFYKLKYGYQVLRLAHYSQNYNDAIKYYDELVGTNNTQSVLQPMSLALKAGALFHTGKQKEAAYLFSKAFSAGEAKRVSNYISFNWAVDAKASRDEYLQLCKNDKEKADMLALFALGNAGSEIAAMKAIFQLNPKADVLQVLAVREINKMEENYFSPALQKQSGGKTFFYNWNEMAGDSAMKVNKTQTEKLQSFLHSTAASGKVNNPALFEVGAAYCALMLRDFKTSRSFLGNAKAMTMSSKLNDQWQLTNLLLNINDANKLDVSFEQQILPSVKWLAQKALADKSTDKSWQGSPWKIFYRNLMSEVVAKRYRQQGDKYKEALAIGSAEYIMNGGIKNEYSAWGLEFMRSNLESREVSDLYKLMASGTKSAYESFLIQNNSIGLNHVIDFAGTAYLRDNQYQEAINWFAKSGGAATQVSKDPFKELFYDQEEMLTGEKVKTTKLAFAKEMMRLQGLVKTDKAKAAGHLYKMALGFYNTTYYGYAWELVEYGRSGVDGYHIPKDANEFQKNYYGAYKAHDYFKMAMDASPDKEFKAKCLFMMAKCSQKQIRRPQYEDFNYNWENYDAGLKTYNPAFMNNKYFPQLKKEFGSTAFYKEIFNTCSYLRDFDIK